jgi:hypothetical protein
MSSRDSEKQRWAYHAHADMDKLYRIIRDYMRDGTIGHKEDGSRTWVEGLTEDYDGQISELIQSLTQAVLADLKEYWGSKNEDMSKDSHTFIKQELGKDFPCFRTDSWNGTVCNPDQCKISFNCYATNSFNGLTPKQKRQWAIDQIKEGVQTFNWEEMQ